MPFSDAYSFAFDLKVASNLISKIFQISSLSLLMFINAHVYICKSITVLVRLPNTRKKRYLETLIDASTEAYA